MTKLEYETLIFSPNLVYSLEEFTALIQTREDGWEQGLQNLLKVCEYKELYEYCAIIKKELEKETK